MTEDAKNSTVDRALRVLEAFLTEDRDLGVLELARKVDLDKSVIHRILTTLVRRGFLEQNPVSRRYRVGLRVWELGQRYVAGHQFEELATAALTRIVENHPYTTGSLSILDGTEVVVLLALRSAGPISVYVDPGTRLPAALTASGRAVLAYASSEDVAAALQAGRSAASHTRPSAAALAKDLAAIRETGHAINRGGYFPGIATVAACVRDQAGTPLGALSVYFPIAPETEDLFAKLPDAVGEAVEEVSRGLSPVL
ncbi:IclR family transcriptional regulator [Dactylosporangium darangshiense]|uniref:IclR family transcriptional regulator n=1 Tax=Dactylosporangium darangshiense TaxID=579108 RepID=A0ABP8DCY8_9ACTN